MVNMTMSDLLSHSWDEKGALPRLGPLLRAQGIDLCDPEAPGALERGTPVYVVADADPVQVQRRMAEAHARLIFVLRDDDEVIGVVDIRELASRAEMLLWRADMVRSPTHAII